jgi:hypothetical protein
MFPFGVVLALLGYSAIYVGVDRLAGDTRTITNILTGNGQFQSKPSSSSSGQPPLAGLVPQSVKNAAAATDSFGLGNSRQLKQVGTLRQDANGKWVWQ